MLCEFCQFTPWGYRRTPTFAHMNRLAHMITKKIIERIDHYLA